MLALQAISLEESESEVNTPFGKFISGKFFSGLFFVLSMVSIVGIAAANAGAADQLLDKPTLTGAAFAVYLLVGILAVMQKNIMSRWKSRGFDIVIGFCNCENTVKKC